MKLFEITLPHFDNEGHSYIRALELWEDQAIGLAGGFTRITSAAGTWRDDATGKIHNDMVALYRVATTSEIFHQLVVHAFRIFPDQIAIMYVHDGEATIALRAPVHHVMNAETGHLGSKGNDIG